MHVTSGRTYPYFSPKEIYSQRTQAYHMRVRGNLHTTPGLTYHVRKHLSRNLEYNQNSCAVAGARSRGIPNFPTPFACCETQFRRELDKTVVHQRLRLSSCYSEVKGNAIAANHVRGSIDSPADPFLPYYFISHSISKISFCKVIVVQNY